MSLPLFGVAAVAIGFGLYPAFILNLFHQVAGKLPF
jgi:hypothetical protein